MKALLSIRQATETDVPALRRLVNAAYRELQDMGMNYTGATQDERITRNRMEGALTIVALMGDTPVATITLEERTDPPSLYLNQLAVAPEHRGLGLARLMFGWAEVEARSRSLPCLMLDTATRAAHLVGIYTKYGFAVIERVQWSGKNYESYIMRKELSRHTLQ
ncbi:MAG TPA: GNAT family N-acetyltransferase [Bacillota bacterium]|nr:GNAT family N-acetyltransferase [Bacillota bacterium]